MEPRPGKVDMSVGVRNSSELKARSSLELVPRAVRPVGPMAECPLGPRTSLAGHSPRPASLLWHCPEAGLKFLCHEYLNGLLCHYVQVDRQEIFKREGDQKVFILSLQKSL